jgi:hypothetical protein
LAREQAPHGIRPPERFATHSGVSPHAADGCIARMMRKPNRARLASDAALLLLWGSGLLVRHERNGALALSPGISLSARRRARPPASPQLPAEVVGDERAVAIAAAEAVVKVRSMDAAEVSRRIERQPVIRGAVRWPLDHRGGPLKLVRDA